ncbi:hypothetical protein CBR_g45675 [Chara braunii]|uniref:Uncharacterized protein n=1 Tax=Chara braunii TaxID=69332 RepID=A0A388K3N9_CHABU|nr:hypothetical protein CBR_g45675 [Chara braunii]|eukprot:GBG64619.1 hypothetical protein CBR_g45675 [Chara braunii]
MFDRSVKRGRIHGEGPNVLSYAAKSRDVARWMIAKGGDKVEIRRIEYGMAFEAWITKAELEERRRLEDESKFWVTALRVPQRVMFHVESMVETSMGRIINSIPPKSDKTRPKLMNVKFELVREAEERFEEELPIKLDNGEIYYIKFACKNTPWCETCRWYFHTATEGCPRMGETPSEQQTGGNPRIDNEGRRRGGDPVNEQNRNIQEAPRDLQQRRNSQSDAGSSAQGNPRTGGAQQQRVERLNNQAWNSATAALPSAHAHQYGGRVQHPQLPLQTPGPHQTEAYQFQALLQLLNQDPRLSSLLPLANAATVPMSSFPMAPYPYSGYQLPNPALGPYGSNPSAMQGGTAIGGR